MNEVRDKHGSSDKSYSVKMKSATDSDKKKSTKKKTKKYNSKK